MKSPQWLVLPSGTQTWRLRIHHLVRSFSHSNLHKFGGFSRANVPIIVPCKAPFVADFPMQMFPYFFPFKPTFLVEKTMASEPQPSLKKKRARAHPWGPRCANQHAILEALQPSKGLTKSLGGRKMVETSVMTQQ